MTTSSQLLRLQGAAVTKLWIPILHLLIGMSHIQHSVWHIYQDDRELGGAYNAITLSLSYNQFQ